jgi:hypothetical protein
MKAAKWQSFILDKTLFEQSKQISLFPLSQLLL